MVIAQVKQLYPDFKHRLINNTDEMYILDYIDEPIHKRQINHLKENESFIALRLRSSYFKRKSYIK